MGQAHRAPRSRSLVHAVPDHAADQFRKRGKTLLSLSTDEVKQALDRAVEMALKEPGTVEEVTDSKGEYAQLVDLTGRVDGVTYTEGTVALRKPNTQYGGLYNKRDYPYVIVTVLTQKQASKLSKRSRMKTADAMGGEATTVLGSKMAGLEGLREKLPAHRELPPAPPMPPEPKEEPIKKEKPVVNKQPEPPTAPPFQKSATVINVAEERYLVFLNGSMLYEGTNRATALETMQTLLLQGEKVRLYKEVPVQARLTLSVGGEDVTLGEPMVQRMQRPQHKSPPATPPAKHARVSYGPMGDLIMATFEDGVELRASDVIKRARRAGKELVPANVLHQLGRLWKRGALVRAGRGLYRKA